jgi:hypothetical protein
LIQGKLNHAGFHLLLHIALGPGLMLTSLYMMLNYRKKMKYLSLKVNEFSSDDGLLQTASPTEE